MIDDIHVYVQALAHLFHPDRSVIDSLITYIIFTRKVTGSLLFA